MIQNILCDILDLCEDTTGLWMRHVHDHVEGSHGIVSFASFPES